MDFGKAFSFVFEDEDWVKKIAVGGLLSLIPVIGIFVVLGWGVEITKRVINGDTEVLPDWSDFGGYLSRGFMVFVIVFIFLLPVILVQSCGTGLPFLTESYEQEALTTALWIVTACFTCITILYSIVAYMVLPAAIARYAATGEAGAAFKLGEIFKMVKDNLGTYGMVLLGGIVASLVASLGTIACVIGVLFTSVYSFAINGHLWGQAYKISGSGTPAAPAEPLPAAD
ncbi:MAG: DUF4013 domain-containing protein [Anaerolineales bacterium]|nr:DUF4013 domain-containing protein [Anaerolineales bacterium]